MKEYQPKKKKYNTLGDLFVEMKNSGLSGMAFSGVEILTKTHRYGLVDSTIKVRKR